MTKVTAALLAIDGMMLIAKRKSTARLPDLWELPGGKIEENETPEECLKREIREEFDINVAVGEHLGTSVYTYDFGTIELMLYRADWEDGNLILKDHEEIRWVFPHELDQFEFAPADRPLVYRLRRGMIEV